MKVDLGIPEELWDSQNAEVGQMMRQVSVDRVLVKLCTKGSIA